MLPNTLFIGAAKCGTTSVFDSLRAHPEVLATADTESHYLVDYGHPLFNSERNYYYSGNSCFSMVGGSNIAATPVYMDYTPDYYYQETPLLFSSKMKNPPKVIIILRDPAERIYSLYKFSANNVGVLAKDISFKRFLSMVDNGHEYLNGRLILKDSFKHGCYSAYLRRWFDLLTAQNVKVVYFEDMVHAPEIVMASLAQFLGIDERFYETFSHEEKNRTMNVKLAWLHKLSHMSRALPMPDKIRSSIAKVYRSLNMSKPKGKSDEDIECLFRLRERYADADKDLEALVGTIPWRTAIGQRTDVSFP